MTLPSGFIRVGQFLFLARRVEIMDQEVRSYTKKEPYSQPILLAHSALKNFTAKQYPEKNPKEDE